MKMGGCGDYSNRVMPEPPRVEDRRATMPDMEGGNLGDGDTGGAMPVPKDFPTSKPKMGGTSWGSNCEPNIGGRGCK